MKKKWGARMMHDSGQILCPLCGSKDVYEAKFSCGSDQFSPTNGQKDENIAPDIEVNIAITVALWVNFSRFIALLKPVKKS